MDIKRREALEMWNQFHGVRVAGSVCVMCVSASTAWVMGFKVRSWVSKYVLSELTGQIMEYDLQ